MIIQSEGGPSVDAHWASLGAAQTKDQFYASWLAILCSQIGGVNGGLLLTASSEPNTFVPAAGWPDLRSQLGYLGPYARAALGERKGSISRYVGREGSPLAKGAVLACPVLIAGEPRAVVALDVEDRSDDRLQLALRLVYWGNAWLSDMGRQELQQLADRRMQAMGLLNGVLVRLFQERGFQTTALTSVNELARQLACDRVSLGMAVDGFIKIQAVSHTGTFDVHSVLMQQIASAMEEALDAAEPLQFPITGDEGLASPDQAELAQAVGAKAVLSVPLSEHGRPIGVLTLERHQGDAFSAAEVSTCVVLGMMIGPVLALKADQERGLAERAWQAIRHGQDKLFGPGHSGIKLAAGMSLVLLVVLSLAKGDYRVAARTVIEGEVQQSTVAPFDGFVAEARVKAGDVVHKGQLMARLDDHELKLELLKWRSEREQYLRKAQQALANMDRAGVKVLDAQVEQAQSQVQLVEDKLQRTRLEAPFDGLIVSGDLSQLVGTPVEQGKVLFSTAPLDAFRVVLQVDERDIDALVPGQLGMLVLSGLPSERFRFKVRQITPVAVAEDGRNFFRVEAQIEGSTNRLRPGMEGIGKVEAGRARLIWIWTHTLMDWMSLTWWSWTP